MLLEFLGPTPLHFYIKSLSKIHGFVSSSYKMSPCALLFSLDCSFFFKKYFQNNSLVWRPMECKKSGKEFTICEKLYVRKTQGP